MKKLLSTIILFAILISSFSMFAYADSDIANNVRFVPTHIKITTADIVVEGFFVNMNKDYEVGNFKDVELEAYINETKVVDGSFGAINKFMMPPMSVYFQSFTFENTYGSDLNGNYDCDDTCYALLNANFSSARSSSTGGSSYYSGAANTDVADLIRFIPISVDVSTSKTVVAGYFVNLNYNKTVSDFTKFKMSLYEGGDKLIDGSFGTINSFKIPPLGLVYQTFTFTDDHTDDLKPGKHTCGDDVYVTFSCSFSSENS